MARGRRGNEAPSAADLRRQLEEYRKRPESAGYRLRLNLSRMIARRLKEDEWSQRRLADAVGMKESFISRILHSDSNCTFDVAGRIMHVLGIQVELIEVLSRYTDRPFPILKYMAQTPFPEATYTSRGTDDESIRAHPARDIEYIQQAFKSTGTDDMGGQHERLYSWGSASGDINV